MEYHTLERVIYILRPPTPRTKEKNKTGRNMSLSFHLLVPPAFFHLKGMGIIHIQKHYNLSQISQTCGTCTAGFATSMSPNRGHAFK